MFIDDDVDLLQSYSHIEIPNEIETESNPFIAIEKIISKSVNKIDVFTDITDAMELDTANSNDESVFKFSFDSLLNLFDYTHDVYGIAVIDCKMPLMDGIEVCDRINEQIDIIKILLTGELKPIEALMAINEGKAQHYIAKGNVDTIKNLTVIINELQYKYFIDITKNYSRILDDRFSFLFDKKYQELFNKIKEKHNIIEYYLVNSTGSFIMKNKERSYIFNSATDKDLDVFCDMHNFLQNKIIDKIQAREIIPNFKIPNNIGVNVDDYFYTAIKFDKYYFNLTEIDDKNKPIGA